MTIYSLVHVCLKLKNPLLIYLCYVCGSVGIRGQCERLTSPLLFWKFQELNWSHQPWWKEPLPTELPSWLNVFPFTMEFTTDLPTYPAPESGNLQTFQVVIVWFIVKFIQQDLPVKCASAGGMPGVHLNGTNKIPEPTKQDVTSFRMSESHHTGTCYFNLGSEMSYEGQISGLEPNSQAPHILDWENHSWPNDCQPSLIESLWVESSRVGKLTVETAC